MNTRNRKPMPRSQKVWVGMKKRCYCKTCKAYPDYGGRGIVMSSEWKANYAAFLADMGEPEEGLSLERIDCNGPYSKENCKWATAKEQARNRRSNRIIEAFGQRKTLAEWSESSPVCRDTIAKRLNRGWKPEEALTVDGTTGQTKRSAHNVNLTAFGQTKNLTEWAREYSLKVDTLRCRLLRGLTLEHSLNMRMYQRGSSAV